MLLLCLCITAKAATQGDKIEIISGTTPAIDWQTQPYKKWTLSGNSVPTFANIPSPTNQVAPIELIVIQPAGQSYTIATNLAQFQGAAWNALPSNSTNHIVFRWEGSTPIMGWWVEQPSPTTVAGGGNVFSTGTPASGALTVYQGTTGTNVIPSAFVVTSATNLNGGNVLVYSVLATNGVSAYGTNGGFLTLYDTNTSPNSVTLLSPPSLSSSYSLAFPLTLVGGTPYWNVISTGVGQMELVAGGGPNTVRHGTSPPSDSPVVEDDLFLTPGSTNRNASTLTHGFIGPLSGSTADFIDGTGQSRSQYDILGAVSTASATVTTIYTLPIAVGTTVMVTTKLAGGGPTNSAAYFREAGFRRGAGSASLIGTNSITTIETSAAMEAGWSLSGNDALLRVAGLAGENINWYVKGNVISVDNGSAAAATGQMVYGDGTVMTYGDGSAMTYY